MTRSQRLAAAGLLVFAVGVFSAVRIAKSSLRLWDFNIYLAASRAWVEGQNPYDEAALRAQWNDAAGMMDLGAQRSIAPPTALVVIAPLAVLPIKVAFVAWMVLSAGLVAGAGVALWTACGWTWRDPRALVMLAGVIGSGPFILGMSVGQPSVPAIACMVIGACQILRGRDRTAGALFALATLLKLQLGAPLILYYLLRGNWRTATWAVAICSLVSTIALVRLQEARVDWVKDWASNVRQSSTAGGRNDFTFENKTRDHLLNLQLPFYALGQDRFHANLSAWASAALFVIAYVLYFCFGARDRSAWEHLLHLGYVLIVMLLPVYHRYYDALVLMVTLAWALRALDEHHYRWYGQLTLVLLVPFLLPVGWAMNLLAHGYVPASVA